MNRAGDGELSAAARGTAWPAARRAVLLVVVVAVPLVFDTRVRPVFARPKATVLVLGAALLVVLAGAEWGRSGRWPWRNALEAPLLAYLAWTAVAAAASDDRAQSVLGAPDSLHGLVTVCALVVLCFAAAAAGLPGARTMLAALWFAGGGAVLAYGAVQLRDRLSAGSGWDPVAWLTAPEDRSIWSTLGNANHLGGFLAILLPVGLVLLVTGSRPGRVAATAMVTMLVVELAVTTSRGALVAGVAGVAALAILWRPDIRTGPVRLAVAALAAGTALAAVVLLSGVRHDRTVDELTGTGAGTTAGLRVELWKGAVRVAAEHPVAGVGPDRFGEAFDEVKGDRFVRTYGPELLATDPHNLFLTVLATTGVPGLAAFVWLVARAGIRLWRTRPPPADQAAGLHAAAAAALVAYLVQAGFNRQAIALDACFWFLLGIACAFPGQTRPLQPVRRGRRSATTAAATATTATPSATHETVSSPPSSDSPPAATSRMSLHHSWRSVSADSRSVRSTAQPRASPGL